MSTLIHRKRFLLVALLLPLALSCSKDSNCGRKLDGGNWEMDTESTRHWIDGELQENSETDLAITHFYDKRDSDGGKLQIKVVQTFPEEESYSTYTDYRITGDCDDYAWKNTVSSWAYASIQELTPKKFQYYFEYHSRGQKHAYEYLFNRTSK